MAEPLNATFFTLKPRDRAVLLPATLVFAAILAAIIAAWLALNWGTISGFAEVFRQAASDPNAMKNDEAAAMRLIGGMFGMFGTTLLFLFPLYLAIAAYEAACLRWMIRGEAPGLFGLTLDHDTWRVYGVYWCWFGVHLVVGTAMSIIMVPVMFMTMGSVFTNPAPDPEELMRLQLSVQLPLTLLQYLPLIFLGVRFGPGAATSIARRRFGFFNAWKVTEGRFWSLLGSFAVLWLGMLVVYGVLAFATYGALAGDFIRELMASWPKPPADESTQQLVTRLFSPQGWTMLGLGHAGGLAVYLIYGLMTYGVNARAALAALEEGKITPEPAS